MILDGNKMKPPRSGKWIVKFRDAAGRQRWVTCDTKRDAKDIEAEKRRESRQPLRSMLDPRMTLAVFAETQWLPRVKVARKLRTWASYTDTMRLHVNPVLGAVPVRDITRPRVRGLLVGLSDQRAPKTVRLVLSVVRSALSAAVEDGLIVANPAFGLGRSLKLSQAADGGTEIIKALDEDQVEILLAAIRSAPTPYERRMLPLFMALARAGLRIGEALGLQWEDVDLIGRTLLIRRQISQGKISTPKSGRERVVSASRELVAALRQHETHTKAEALQCGWGGMPALVFVTTAGTALVEPRVRQVMKAALKRAGLPLHFTPHSLRHSFGSILSARGESMQYVQEQMGHASILETTRTYGRWIRKQPLQGGVDGLDRGYGSKVVAERVAVGQQVRAGIQFSKPPQPMSPLTAGSGIGGRRAGCSAPCT